MEVEDQNSAKTQELSTNPSKNDNVPSLPRDPTLDCAICLQRFVQPIQLPCSHTFCFLCAKGIALQRQPCALCRTDIPADFLTKPGQFQAKHRSKPGTEDIATHMWYYQGHKGWWQYDIRTSADIEDAYNRKDKSIDILIAGAIYVIDLEEMVQYRRDMNSRKRKIKRDIVDAQKKGVAGMTGSTSSTDTSTSASTLGASDSQLRQGPIGDGNDPVVGSQTGGCN
ncbi:E3 ubiquitin-protein ligase rnf146-like [Styela clava]